MRLTTFLFTWDTNGPGKTRVVKDRPPSQAALVVKNLPANAGDQHSISGLGRFPWRRELGSWYLMGTEFQFRKVKNSNGG